MDGDRSTAEGDLESYLVFELGRDTFTTPPPDLLGIDVEKVAGHPPRG
jgi:hypothetical protein